MSNGAVQDAWNLYQQAMLTGVPTTQYNNAMIAAGFGDPAKDPFGVMANQQAAFSSAGLQTGSPTAQNIAKFGSQIEQQGYGNMSYGPSADVSALDPTLAEQGFKNYYDRARATLSGAFTPPPVTNTQPIPARAPGSMAQDMPQPTLPGASWEPNRPTATAPSMQPSSVSGSPGLINWQSMGQPSQQIATSLGTVQRPDRPAIQLSQPGLINSQMGVTSFDPTQSRQFNRQQMAPEQNPSYISSTDLELLNRQRQGSVIDRFGVYNPNFQRN